MSESAQLFQCRHCGTPFEQEAPDQEFCCSGCSFVNDLIESSGLDRFYDLKGRDRILPAGNAVLVKPETTWASELQAAAESTGASLPQAKLDLQGVSCIGCVWLIDALFQQLPGAGRILIDASRGEIEVSWFPGQFDLPAFVQKVGQFGYRLAPASTSEKPSSASGLRLGLCGGLALNAMGFTLPRYMGMTEAFQLAGFFELVAAFSATLSLMFGGSYFISRAWGALKAGQLHLDVPIAGGVIAAWLGSVVGWLVGSAGLLYFDFVAVFIFLMLLGRRLQEVSVTRNRSRLLRADPLLRTIRILENDEAKSQPVENLALADSFSVPPAGVVPVNAELEEDSATLSLEWINGEAEARVWNRGAHLPAGAVNLGKKEVRLKARENWQDSLLQRLSSATERGDDPAARWLDRMLRFYLLVVLFLALVGGVVWWFLGGDWARALQVTISVLVVSCPCALGVAIPMAHELSVAELRRQGLFVRKPDLWGRLLRVKDIVFDKTGTLTLDTPRLKNSAELQNLSGSARMALSHLVMDSRHPVSGSLREALAAIKALQNGSHEPVEEIPGFGLKFADEAGAHWSLRRPEPTESGDAIFSQNDQVLAAFEFEDAVRLDAERELDALRRRGHSVFLLSGDRAEKVAAMATALGIPNDQALARQSPEQKAEWIQTHAPRCLFVGDGANDSLAADAALVRGTPAVERCLLAEKADFYFLSRGLRPLRTLLDLAILRRRAVLRAFGFALTYNIGVVALSLSGRMNPLLAAILMPLSSIVTLLIVSLTLKGNK